MSNNNTRAVALITGAAHRIGAEISRQLHDCGFDIALHYRSSEDTARQLQDVLQAKRADSVRLFCADLNEAGACEKLLTEVQQSFGRVDALINNASSFYPTPMGSISEVQWQDLIGSNLRAPLFLSQAAAPLLRASKGCIVNIVDVHAQRPLKNHTVYSVAKAGNVMLIKSLARELGPDIRVNGVAPGAILWPEQALSEDEKDIILQRTALKRSGTPEDIAKTVRFLVAEAHYITGQIIPVDGGRSLQQ
ncbi:MAG: pteridine reductase [gamma proteobacterium symbiont of Bathyaustriella thionipta]|nr:pteridine reductase [gamma proteobacterium symbiont of Bathyaustriella thionipta]